MALYVDGPAAHEILDAFRAYERAAKVLEECWTRTRAGVIALLESVEGMYATTSPDANGLCKSYGPMFEDAWFESSAETSKHTDVGDRVHAMLQEHRRLVFMEQGAARALVGLALEPGPGEHYDEIEVKAVAKTLRRVFGRVAS